MLRFWRVKRFHACEYMCHDLSHVIAGRKYTWDSSGVQLPYTIRIALYHSSEDEISGLSCFQFPVCICTYLEAMSEGVEGKFVGALIIKTHYRQQHLGNAGMSIAKFLSINICIIVLFCFFRFDQVCDYNTRITEFTWQAVFRVGPELYQYASGPARLDSQKLPRAIRRRRIIRIRMSTK